MEVFIWLILRLFNSSCVLFYPNVIAFFGSQLPSTRKYPDSSLIYFPNVVWSYLVPSKGFCPVLRSPKCSNWFFLFIYHKYFLRYSIISISYIQERRADSNQEIAEKSENKEWCLIFLRFVNKTDYLHCSEPKSGNIDPEWSLSSHCVQVSICQW